MIARLLAAIAAFTALGHHPYNYYQLARCIISPVAAWVALGAYQSRKHGWAWTFGVLAVFFNPIIPMHLGRDAWRPVDLTTGVLLILSFYFIDSPLHETPK